MTRMLSAARIEAFQETLREEGFGEIVMVERPANGSLPRHSHPFEAKAMVLGGELVLVGAQGERCYRAGDIFHLQPDEPHAERFGPEGLYYLVGRR